jgi:hypothetical protein
MAHSVTKRFCLPKVPGRAKLILCLRLSRDEREQASAQDEKWGQSFCASASAASRDRPLPCQVPSLTILLKRPDHVVDHSASLDALVPRLFARPSVCKRLLHFLDPVTRPSVLFSRRAVVALSPGPCGMPRGPRLPCCQTGSAHSLDPASPSA